MQITYISILLNSLPVDELAEGAFSYGGATHDTSMIQAVHAGVHVHGITTLKATTTRHHPVIASVE